MVTSHKLKFNVPGEFTAAGWAKYIYNLIKGANKQLLKNEDICLAYNTFVDCLEKNSTHFYTFYPYKKYKSGFTLNNNINAIYGIPGRYVYNPTSELKTCLDDILNSYLPLYNMVKDEVIPYMEKKYAEVCTKKEIKIIKREISKYEKKIKKYQENIYSYQNKLSEFNNRLTELEK